ncbi:hypothetical protein GQX74_003879 [Glossina fuscipes]|nr:hypothetical protein GQX74_003879 [Glossina fuscipes]
MKPSDPHTGSAPTVKLGGQDLGQFEMLARFCLGGNIKFNSSLNSEAVASFCKSISNSSVTSSNHVVVVSNNSIFVPLLTYGNSCSLRLKRTIEACAESTMDISKQNSLYISAFLYIC